MTTDSNALFRALGRFHKAARAATLPRTSSANHLGAYGQEPDDIDWPEGDLQSVTSPVGAIGAVTFPKQLILETVGELLEDLGIPPRQRSDHLRLLEQRLHRKNRSSLTQPITAKGYFSQELPSPSLEQLDHEFFSDPSCFRGRAPTNSPRGRAQRWVMLELHKAGVITVARHAELIEALVCNDVERGRKANLRWDGVGYYYQAKATLYWDREITAFRPTASGCLANKLPINIAHRDR